MSSLSWAAELIKHAKPRESTHAPKIQLALKNNNVLLRQAKCANDRSAPLRTLLGFSGLEASEMCLSAGGRASGNETFTAPQSSDAAKRSRSGSRSIIAQHILNWTVPHRQRCGPNIDGFQFRHLEDWNLHYSAGGVIYCYCLQRYAHNQYFDTFVCITKIIVIQVD